MAKSTPDILAIHARRTPERAALIEDPPNGPTTVWSFAELDRQTNRLANTLSALGVQPGQKVIWCGMNSPGVVWMMHAARKIGAVAVPLNYRLSPEEAAYIVDDSDAVLVYADADYVDLFAGIRAEIPKVKHVLIFGGAPGPDMLAVDALLDRASDAGPRTDPSGAAVNTMIYTSGTTGHPKGAVRAALGDPELLRQLVARIGYVPEDVYLTTGPLYHSGPGGFMMIAQTLGNTVVVQRKFDAVDWLRLVEQHRVTTTFSAPTPIRMVCDLPAETKARFDRSSMRRMIGNAAPWSFALKKAYLADFPEDSLWEVYGSTELGVNNVLAPEDQLRKPGSCGQAAPGVELRLIDEKGQEISEPNVPGELFVRSKAAFSSYYKAHEKFEKSRRGDFLTVGDIAYFDDEGYYYICDRKNDMIISGGMNIYPAEIESALDHHPDVADVAVIGIPSEPWGESVHAVVVRRGNGLTEDALLAFAREHLAGYKIPRSISWSDEIPRNASGKILKKVLREPFWKDRERQVG
ncbi:MAG: AMP-binding protein [Deltaproteobacteria bacterium]|nr:MAG: AMP-binding protein [Deltaproteobacteria bacterium]